MAIDNQFLKVPKQSPATIEYGIIYSTTDEREKNIPLWVHFVSHPHHDPG